MSSLNHSATAAYKNIVEKFSDKIFEQLFWGMPTVNHIANKGGNKGRITETKMRMAADLVRRYTSSFTERETHSTEPIHYDTIRAKAEFRVDPGELEDDYLGMMRKTGQDPKDNPLQLYQIMGHINQIADEAEVALWQGAEAGAIDDSTPLTGLFDGFGHQFADAITATTLTPYTTGALTSANILGHIRGMYDNLHPALKRGKAVCYMSVDDQQNYLIATADYAKYTQRDFTTAQFDTGNMKMVFLPGIPKDAIVITFEENLVRNYDGDGDMSTFHIDENLYTVDFGLVFRIGATVRWLEDEYLVVNDGWS